VRAPLRFRLARFLLRLILGSEAYAYATAAARAWPREAALMAALKAEELEKHEALLAEQKAARDARYAARKSAKKERRRGY